MENNKKLSVDSTEIMKASNALANAQKYVASAQNKINSMGIRSISGPGMAPAGIMANIKENMSNILSKESALLSQISKDLKYNATQLSNVDIKKNTINGTKKTGSTKKNGSTKKTLQMETQLVQEIKTKKTEYAVRSVLLDNAKDLITANIVVLPIHPTVNIITQELQNLEKYLQSGDLVSAASSYKFLKAFGSEIDAQALLAKYGYKAEERDGEYIILKVEEDNSNSSTETATNKDESSPSENTTNNNEHDVVAEETVNATPEESPKENLSVNESNNQNKTENVVNTTNNHNNSSNNNNYSNSSNHSQSGVENTSTEVNNEDTLTQVETDAITKQSPTDIGDSTKENIKETPKNNVVSITDDNKTTATKKSSGLGAAVPIGLGTIATGAAAVAGVRYVKNRHDHQEEYEDDYDDENNNLDDNNEEYVDSAQYDDGSSYMDDDYLGPVDNSDISTEDSYVDPGELEEIEDFSNDAVLEDLNSNY